MSQVNTTLCFFFNFLYLILKVNRLEKKIIRSTSFAVPLRSQLNHRSRTSVMFGYILGNFFHFVCVFRKRILE